MPNNKFNSNTKTKAWFPFPKYLFKTENHPVRQSTLKCSSSFEAALSIQETQMIDGMTASLQCNEREAIRIALYEATKRASEAYEGYFECARWDTQKRGHTARFRKGKWSLPKIEQAEASLAAKHLKISDKEFVRLALIWLARGIKAESIIRLTNTPRIPKDDVAMNWSRENRGKPASESVKKLKDARDEAKELSDYLFEQKEAKAQGEKSFREGLPKEVLRQLDNEQLERKIDGESWEQSIRDDYQEISDYEFLVRCKMREFQCDYKLAELFAEDERQEHELFMQMTTKEQIQHMKQRDWEINSIAREQEAILREKKLKHEEELERWQSEYEAREKTWFGYVNNHRLCMRMIGAKEPFPHLPNPLPEGYLMPDDWNQEHVG